MKLEAFKYSIAILLFLTITFFWWAGAHYNKATDIPYQVITESAEYWKQYRDAASR